MSSTFPSPTRETTPARESMAPADAVMHVSANGAGCVIDVRTPFEVSTERVEGARHIPLEELASRLNELEALDGDRLLLCQSGKRAEMARRKLVDAGVESVVVIEGGLTAYAAAGGVTVKDRKGMSLERQVRIAAGGLVVIGVALGFLVHPALFGLAGFVGAGLVFAGLTDSCAMGLLIAKMPWNRAAPACEQAAD